MISQAVNTGGEPVSVEGVEKNRQKKKKNNRLIIN